MFLIYLSTHIYKLGPTLEYAVFF